MRFRKSHQPPLQRELVKIYGNFLQLFLMFFVSSLIALLIFSLLTKYVFFALGSVLLRLNALHNFNMVVLFLLFTLFFTVLFSFMTVIINEAVRSAKTRVWSFDKDLIVSRVVRLSFFIFVVNLLTNTVLVSQNVAFSPWVLFVLLFLHLILFFVPPAISLDDFSFSKSVEVSVKLFFSHWWWVLAWLLFSVFLLVVGEGVLFFILSPSIGKFIIPLFNVFFVLPLLIILQSLIYLRVMYRLAP
jgi:hypothetical protein